MCAPPTATDSLRRLPPKSGSDSGVRLQIDGPRCPAYTARMASSEDPESDLPVVPHQDAAPGVGSVELLPILTGTIQAPPDKHQRARTRARMTAEALYTYTDCTLQELAERPELEGIPYQKLSRWRKLDKWEEKRAEANRKAMKRVFIQLNDSLSQQRQRSLMMLDETANLMHRMLMDTEEPLQRPRADQAAKTLIDAIKAKDQLQAAIVSAADPERVKAPNAEVAGLSDETLYEISQALVRQRMIKEGQVAAVGKSDSDGSALDESASGQSAPDGSASTPGPAT
jgi:hypothetical protein